MNVTSFKKKLALTKNWLKSRQLQAVIFEDPVDLFYWTGLHLSLGTLLITRQSAKLFVDARYIESCVKKAPVKSVPASEIKFPKGSIAFDSGATSCARLSALKKLTKKGDTKWAPYLHMGKEVRLLKESLEVAKIKKACSLACLAMSHVKNLLKVGISEEQIAQAIKLFYLENEAGLSFEPIVAFGANSAMPHYTPRKTKLKKNDIALIDMGCILEGYCSDMTRVFFCGNPPKKLVCAYKAVKEALEKSMHLCKPGVSVATLDHTAKSAILEKDFSCYEHALGHGVGLEVHELPFVSEKKTSTNLKF